MKMVITGQQCNVSTILPTIAENYSTEIKTKSNRPYIVVAVTVSSRDFPTSLKLGPGATEFGKNSARAGKLGKIRLKEIRNMMCIINNV